jgi:hypothetical protein
MGKLDFFAPLGRTKSRGVWKSMMYTPQNADSCVMIVVDVIKTIETSTYLFLGPKHLVGAAGRL